MCKLNFFDRLHLSEIGIIIFSSVPFSHSRSLNDKLVFKTSEEVYSAEKINSLQEFNYNYFTFLHPKHFTVSYYVIMIISLPVQL